MTNIMQIILGLCLLAVAAAAKLPFEHGEGELWGGYDYHRRVGIPEAARIKKAEEEYLKNGGADGGGPTKIAGGSPAGLGQFPYQAGLLISTLRGTSVCGAVLITHNRVLTAAHCWTDGVTNVLQFEVVLGSTTLFSGGTRIRTSVVEAHADYDQRTISMDIAIIYTAWVFYTDNIQPVSLPYGAALNETFAGYGAVVSGFGRTGDTVGISLNQFLSYVDVDVITNEACAQIFAIILDSTLCISGVDGKSSCGGDSGGPLVTTYNGETILIGLVSFGSARGCELSFPAGYVRVTAFMDWIQARL